MGDGHKILCPLSPEASNVHVPIRRELRKTCPTDTREFKERVEANDVCPRTKVMSKLSNCHEFW